MTTTDWFESESAPPPIEPALAAVGDALLDDPASPFIALHAALAHAASGDLGPLGRLGARCHAADEAPTREVVAPLCNALIAAGEEHWSDAVDGLEAALRRLVTVGGSAANGRSWRRPWSSRWRAVVAMPRRLRSSTPGSTDGPRPSMRGGGSYSRARHSPSDRRRLSVRR